MNKILGKIARPFEIGAGIAAIVMMIATAADVFLKYIFNSPSTNVAEVTAYSLMVCIVFLPLGSVELRHEHISADLVVQNLPIRIRNGLYVLSSLIAVAVVAIFIYQTALDAIASTEKLEIQMGSGPIYIWPSKWFLPVGFTFLAICLISNAVTCARNLSTFAARSPASEIE